MSTAQDLPGLYGEPVAAPVAAPPALRLVPTQPLDFDDAVRRVRPRLHRYAIRRLGDAHEAEELVQEALLRAYTHRDQLHTEEDLSAWSTVVTGRLVIDRLRVRGRSTSVADVPEGSRVGRDTAEVVVARDEARTALDALDAMPTRQASLLWAREVEGKSYEELCEQFGMTEPAVRSVLTRARKALRREYELRGGTVPVGGLAVLAPWITGLTWAEKLRKCAHRLTAPAVLGAAGIAALGGLVLSPFGSDSGHAPRTFSPSQAVVASSVQSAAAPKVVSRAGATATSVASGRTGSSSAPALDPHDTALRRQVHTLTTPIGCTKSNTNLATDPTHITGAWVGNQDCEQNSTRVGVNAPTSVSGYDGASVDLGNNDLACSTLGPVTSTPAGKTITCSEASQ